MSDNARWSVERNEDDRNTASPHAAEALAGSSSPPWSDEEISIWTYINPLLQRRALLIVVPVTLAIVVAIWSLHFPREYSASASFIPQDPAPMQSGLSQLTSQFGLLASRANTNSPQFYVDLLQSRGVLSEAVITKYDVRGSQPFSGDLISYFDIQTRDRDEAVALAVKGLRRALLAQADRVTGVVRFEISTRNPGLSSLVVGRLLELTNVFNLTRRQSQARAEREFLDRRLQDAKAQLSAAEDALVSFDAQNRRIGDSPQLAAQEERLRRQVGVKQQLVAGLESSFEAAAIEEVRNTPVITVIDRPEGFVEKKPRGTIGNTMLAFVAGLFIALALVFFLNYLDRQEREKSPGYSEFLRLRRGFFRRLPSANLPRNT